MSMLLALILILILLPVAVRVQRLRARGVITDDRPLDRVLRERITGQPAPLSLPDYRQSRLRYYRTVFVTIPAVVVGLAVVVAAFAKPHHVIGLVMGPAFLSGVLVLAVSEDRFAGVSARLRIA
jgi:hypothetical protein